MSNVNQPIYGEIYFHHNEIDGKLYFGQALTSKTNNWRKRCREHFRRLKSYSHPNIDLQQAFHETGGAFTTGSMAVAYSKQELNDLETFYIRAFNTTDSLFGYNKTYGGDSGGVYTQAAKSNISRSLKGKKKSSEHCAAISHSMRGFKHTEETKAKLSAQRKGIINLGPNTPEHNKNISLSLKGKPWSAARRAAQNNRMK